jgi:hypothetical protein
MKPIKTPNGHSGGWALEKGKDERIYISADDLGFWIEEAINYIGESDLCTHCGAKASDSAKAKLFNHLHDRIKEIAEKAVL